MAARETSARATLARMPRLRRLLVLAPVMALLLPALAPAATGDSLSIRFASRVVAYGAATDVGGALKIGGIPRAGAKIHLETKRIPTDALFYDEGAPVRTSPTGAYSFDFVPVRSALVRVFASEHDLRSAAKRLSVVPRQRLTYRHPSRNVLVETLRVAVPRSVSLRGSRVYLYLGSPSARRVPFKRTQALRRVRPGLWKMTARFRLPARWRGGWKFVSCYRAPTHTGMYDPAQRRCSRRAQAATARASAAGSAAPAAARAAQRNDLR